MSEWAAAVPLTSGGEIVPVPQLSPSELEQLAALERACLVVDGGRLKLEWGALRARPGDSTNDFVYVEDDEIVGFLGIYQWRPIDAELCGMVHPSWRRRGIGAALYDAASAELERRQPGRVLMIVDRHGEPGRRFALSRGGELEHSEHRMQQRREPDPRADASPVEVRDARPEPDDASFVASCLAAAFDEELARFDATDEAATAHLLAGTRVIERLPGREPVGVMRVEREGSVASIYGFAVLPEEQGKGYGRAALSAVTRDLHRSGVGTISLEVLSTNDHALHLYTTCGFDAIGTEDYYAMPVGEA